uniref:Equilibrative nucleotide transporter 3-like n=1 Tax=Tanacetum cinerariifolium TaxID=118510 RepID=A0A6L2P2X3_TANCI|nr:equilibrative nucleotide transporter 3-like [Tanacetum cinerariifolium]
MEQMSRIREQAIPRVRNNPGRRPGSISSLPGLRPGLFLTRVCAFPQDFLTCFHCDNSLVRWELDHRVNGQAYRFKVSHSGSPYKVVIWQMTLTIANSTSTILFLPASLMVIHMSITPKGWELGPPMVFETGNSWGERSRSSQVSSEPSSYSVSELVSWYSGLFPLVLDLSHLALSLALLWFSNLIYLLGCESSLTLEDSSDFCWWSGFSHIGTHVPRMTPNVEVNLRGLLEIGEKTSIFMNIWISLASPELTPSPDFSFDIPASLELSRDSEPDVSFDMSASPECLSGLACASLAEVCFLVVIKILDYAYNVFDEMVDLKALRNTCPSLAEFWSKENHSDTWKSRKERTSPDTLLNDRDEEIPLIECKKLESREGFKIAVLARFFLIPVFYFMAKYVDQGWMIFLTSFLGLTKGSLPFVCLLLLQEAMRDLAIQVCFLVVIKILDYAYNVFDEMVDLKALSDTWKSRKERTSPDTLLNDRDEEIPLIECKKLESREGFKIAVLARFFLIPVFYFMAKYVDQGWMIFLTSFLGLTKGSLPFVCLLLLQEAMRLEDEIKRDMGAQIAKLASYHRKN